MNKEQTSGRNATKHTPGPWIASATQSKYGSWGIFLPGSMYNVLDNSAPHANSEANARLMAAAPKLLKALQGLLAYAETQNPSPNTSKSIIAARAAIAKATSK